MLPTDIHTRDTRVMIWHYMHKTDSALLDI